MEKKNTRKGRGIRTFMCGWLFKAGVEVGKMEVDKDTREADRKRQKGGRRDGWMGARVRTWLLFVIYYISLV